MKDWVLIGIISLKGGAENSTGGRFAANTTMTFMSSFLYLLLTFFRFISNIISHVGKFSQKLYLAI